MSSYDEIKALYLAGDHAGAAALCDAHRDELARDGAGCTLAGATMMALDRRDAAVAWLTAATALEPDTVRVWHNLGDVLQGYGRLQEAAGHFETALQLAPEDGERWSALGRLLALAEAFPDALLCLDEALRRTPEDAAALAAKGRVLHRLGRRQEARDVYAAVLTLQPADAETLTNQGALLQDAGATAEALACYDRALAIRPDLRDAWSNRAKALWDVGRLDEAVAAFDRALEIRPDDPALVADRGMCRLLGGDYARGLVDYEARLAAGGATRMLAPLWQGEDPRGRHILVTAEQGHGDTFQFARYAATLVARGARVTLLAPAAIVPMLASLRGICDVVAHAGPDDAFDHQVGLLSLPLRLGVEAGFAAAAPYLAADPARVARWAEIVGERGFRVGIAWQGNPLFRRDAGRSIPLDQFLPLADLPGTRVISLQQRDGLDQLDRVAPERRPEILPGPVDGDGVFTDTAAILMSLDLVVTSDSALAHLAGALGVPVWLALAHVPDWRWLMSGETCPWYPTMRLFRQTQPGDWADVFARIADALADEVTARAPAPPMIPCSPGELLDKISILEIKSERIHDREKRRYVETELAQLRAVQAVAGTSDRLASLSAELKAVNEALWSVEDDLRRCEDEQRFDDAFIGLARAVYKNNDRRAALKREINILQGSRLVEQKSYARAS